MVLDHHNSAQPDLPQPLALVYPRSFGQELDLAPDSGAVLARYSIHASASQDDVALPTDSVRPFHRSGSLPHRPGHSHSLVPQMTR